MLQAVKTLESADVVLTQKFDLISLKPPDLETVLQCKTHRVTHVEE